MKDVWGYSMGGGGVLIMANLKHAVENAKDKVVGEMKVAAGKVTGNEELELRGEIQSGKADVKGKIEDVVDRRI
jgi:uncharacterized protein YjbJ (UPF0337 family)